MKHLSKFFTPPLSEDDRTAIQRVLGLNSVPFLFVERLAKQILFSQAYHHPSLTLAGLTEEEVGYWTVTNGFSFTVCVDHLVQNANSHKVAVAKSPLTGALSLWDTLIPYPCRLYKPGDGSRGFQVTLLPEHAEDSLRRLFDRLLELELLLAEAEVALLWLRSGEARFPLLFHYVRGRLVRAGSSPRLYEIGYQFDAGELPVDALAEAMGTRAMFVPVIVENDASASLWERLDHAFASAIRSLGLKAPAGLPLPRPTEESRL